MGDVELTRVSYGRTDALAMAHGIEIAFDALPSRWEERDEVEILFADGSMLHLDARPDQGATAFAWMRDPSTTWLLQLEPLALNVLQVHLQEHHRDIVGPGV
ncbi:hypothetical protein [Methylobacterium sp. A54F]